MSTRFAILLQKVVFDFQPSFQFFSDFVLIPFHILQLRFCVRSFSYQRKLSLIYQYQNVSMQVDLRVTLDAVVVQSLFDFCLIHLPPSRFIFAFLGLGKVRFLPFIVSI